MAKEKKKKTKSKRVEVTVPVHPADLPAIEDHEVLVVPTALEPHEAKPLPKSVKGMPCTVQPVSPLIFGDNYLWLRLDEGFTMPGDGETPMRAVVSFETVPPAHPPVPD